MGSGVGAAVLLTPLLLVGSSSGVRAAAGGGKARPPPTGRPAQPCAAAVNVGRLCRSCQCAVQ